MYALRTDHNLKHKNVTVLYVMCDPYVYDDGGKEKQASFFFFFFLRENQSSTHVYMQ